MGSLEERMSRVEAKVEEQGKLEQRMNGRFDQVEHQLDQRFTQIDLRFTQVDESFRELRSLIVGLDGKYETRFMWLIGLQFATLIAIVAGMFGIVTKLI
jgi:hypothetical protein